jgi:hypothetical protein
MAVKGLTPQLAERGKIKIGMKGEEKTSSQGKKFMLPVKLDHFLITTMQRDAAGRLMPDVALMARLKPEGGKITEIPVRLLYDDIDLNFPTRYACYKGNRCWCSGDGETAQRLDEAANTRMLIAPVNELTPTTPARTNAKSWAPCRCSLRGLTGSAGCGNSGPRVGTRSTPSSPAWP